MTMEVKINRISQNIIKSIYAVYKENIEDTDNLLDVYNDSKRRQLEIVLENVNELVKLFPTEGKSSKSGKSEGKSADKVKRALNPYVMFCNEKRAEVKEDNPDLAPKEITKVLGQMWQELDKDEKEKYRPATTTPAKKKSPPGRGISGWILFCSKHRASTQRDNSDLPPKDITKVLGQMWRNLSDEERQEYNDKAKSKVEDMKKYHDESDKISEDEVEKVSEPEDEEVEEEKPKKEKKSKKSKVSEPQDDEVEEEKPKKEKKSKKSKVSEPEDDEVEEEKPKKEKSKKSKVSEPEDEEVEEEKPKKKEKKSKSSSDDEIDRKVRSIFDDEEVAAKPTKRSPSKVPKPKKS